MSNWSKAAVALVAAMLILATMAMVGFTEVAKGFVITLVVIMMLMNLWGVVRFIQSTLLRIMHFLARKFGYPLSTCSSCKSPHLFPIRRRGVQFYSYESLEQEDLFTVAAPMCDHCWKYYRRGAVAYKGHLLIGPRQNPATPEGRPSPEPREERKEKVTAWQATRAKGMSILRSIAAPYEQKPTAPTTKPTAGSNTRPTAGTTTKTPAGTTRMPTRSHIRAGSAYETAKCRTCLDMKHITRGYDGQRVSCPSCQRG